MSLPLLIHLVFHPASAAGRALALELHRALNDDPALPGLRVPTVFAREDRSGLPPIEHELDEAERNVVVPLIDDEMVLEPGDLPVGRQTWAQFVGDLWTKCNASAHRFLPIQLSESAWPLDPRLSETNFIRAFAQPDASRTAWLIRRVVVEICRYIEGEERGERLPLRLFLSHAKQDIAAEPKVFDAINAHLNATQPVKMWIDSAEIDAGSQFSDAIKDGVRDSLLLVLATKSYSGRAWCRKELLLAKRYGRPFIVVDALEGLDLRSFPYAGNAPRLRWSEGGAGRAIDLLLKETLRHLHARHVLERVKHADDVVLTAPPELATAVRILRGKPVLYPDPPLGDEEREEFEPLDLRLETPLQRAAQGSALAKVPIVLSISESDDIEQHGVTTMHLDAALHEISRQLLVRGACLEYGGHLGPEGYTIALFDMVRAYSALSGLPPAERIIHDVGWPLPLAKLPAKDRAKHAGVAMFRRIPRPDGVADLDPETFVEEPAYFPATSPERRYAWARGMTAMRQAQARSSSPANAAARARIVLGGKIGPTKKMEEGREIEVWYSGRIPGVVEEVLLSLKAGQPLYLIGAYGGAAALAIDLLEGKSRVDFTWEFQRKAPHSEGMRAIYDRRGPRWEDYPELATFFAGIGVAGLSAMNGLNAEQNRELFWSRDLHRTVELVLEGLTDVAS